MARLVSAVDAVGDDGKAAGYIPDKISELLEELAQRLGAAKAFGGAPTD
jgi:hypothetical protein